MGKALPFLLCDLCLSQYVFSRNSLHKLHKFVKIENKNEKKRIENETKFTKDTSNNNNNSNHSNLLSMPLFSDTTDNNISGISGNNLLNDDLFDANGKLTNINEYIHAKNVFEWTQNNNITSGAQDYVPTLSPIVSQDSQFTSSTSNLSVISPGGGLNGVDFMQFQQYLQAYKEHRSKFDIIRNEYAGIFPVPMIIELYKYVVNIFIHNSLIQYIRDIVIAIRLHPEVDQGCSSLRSQEALIISAKFAAFMTRLEPKYKQFRIDHSKKFTSNSSSSSVFDGTNPNSNTPKITNKSNDETMDDNRNSHNNHNNHNNRDISDDSNTHRQISHVDDMKRGSATFSDDARHMALINRTFTGDNDEDDFYDGDRGLNNASSNIQQQQRRNSNNNNNNNNNNNSNNNNEEETKDGEYEAVQRKRQEEKENERKRSKIYDLIARIHFVRPTDIDNVSIEILAHRIRCFTSNLNINTNMNMNINDTRIGIGNALHSQVQLLQTAAAQPMSNKAMSTHQYNYDYQWNDPRTVQFKRQQQHQSLQQQQNKMYKENKEQKESKTHKDSLNTNTEETTLTQHKSSTTTNTKEFSESPATSTSLANMPTVFRQTSMPNTFGADDNNNSGNVTDTSPTRRRMLNLNTQHSDPRNPHLTTAGNAVGHAWSRPSSARARHASGMGMGGIRTTPVTPRLGVGAHSVGFGFGRRYRLTPKDQKKLQRRARKRLLRAYSLNKDKNKNKNKNKSKNKNKNKMKNKNKNSKSKSDNTDSKNKSKNEKKENIEKIENLQVEHHTAESDFEYEFDFDTELFNDSSDGLDIDINENDDEFDESESSDEADINTDTSDDDDDDDDDLNNNGNELQPGKKVNEQELLNPFEVAQLTAAEEEEERKKKNKGKSISPGNQSDFFNPFDVNLYEASNSPNDANSGKKGKGKSKSKSKSKNKNKGGRFDDSDDEYNNDALNTSFGFNNHDIYNSGSNNNNNNNSNNDNENYDWRHNNGDMSDRQQAHTNNGYDYNYGNGNSDNNQHNYDPYGYGYNSYNQDYDERKQHSGGQMLNISRNDSGEAMMRRPQRIMHQTSDNSPVRTRGSNDMPPYDESYNDYQRPLGIAEKLVSNLLRNVLFPPK